MTAVSIDNESKVAAQVGNPLLGQIREFIETDEPSALDPIGIVARAIRGRVFDIGLAAIALGLLLAILAWLTISPLYQSTGVLRILPKEAKLLYADSDDSRLRLYDAFTNAEVHLMQSRPVLESAWTMLHDLAHDSPDQDFRMPADAGDLGRIVNIKNRKGLVTVAASSRDRVLAAASVNAVLDAYQAHKDAARTRVTDLRRNELQQREKTLRVMLQELDERYVQIGGEHDLTSLSKAHIAKTAQLEILEERIGEIGNTIAQFQTTGAVGADDIRNAEIQRALLLDQAMAEMTYERASRLAELATLRRRYQPTYEKILSAELELVTIEAAITERRDQITTLGNVGALTGGTEQSSEQSLDELESVRKKLLQRRVALSAEASELIGKLIKIRRVSAEQARIGDLLDETKQALDEVLVESQAGLSQAIEVIARGKVPDRPIEDKRVPIAFGAALFGALGTLVAFILASLLYPRIRFSDDLDPKVSGKIAVIVPDSVDDGTDMERASFKLRNEIDLRRAGTDEPVVVGITGVSSAGNTSGMTVALSTAFAARKLSVLLIDANAASGVTARFGLDGRPGLANVMGGDRFLQDVTASQSTALGDLNVLGTGAATDKAIPDRVSTFAMQDFRSLIDKAASLHDVVIVDLGELAAGRHSALGASVSEQLVLVASVGDPKRSVNNATSLLDRVAPERYVLAFDRASSLDPMLEPHNEHLPLSHNLKRWLAPFRKLLESK